MRKTGTVQQHLSECVTCSTGCRARQEFKLQPAAVLTCTMFLGRVWTVFMYLWYSITTMWKGPKPKPTQHQTFTTSNLSFTSKPKTTS